MSDKQIPSAELVEALMKDPVKRALLVHLLQQEKDSFEAYKRREIKLTPVQNARKVHCESPTALQRRRALEKLNEDTTTSEGSSSDPSEVKGPKMPFERLLQGVNAYVEVRRDNIDRSEGIKAVMKLMGATVKDEFTSDVTHVVFKDGSFTTYQKAKLMNVHLVSVLWLDAIRRNNARVPEKNYPAFGGQVCDQNVSILCSQLQKDYEDVIKDEKRRTISCSQKCSKTTIDKNRRHTMTTPQASMSSYLTARKSSQLNLSSEDLEVSSIIENTKSPDITSDDSDCGIVDGQTSNKRSKEKINLLTMSPSITDDMSNASFSKAGCNKNSESSDSVSLLGGFKTKHKRQTINIISDMVITPNIEPVQNNLEKKLSNRVLQNSNLQSTMSSLRISSGTDNTKSGLDKRFEETSSDDRTKSGLDNDIESINVLMKRSRSRSTNKENRTDKKNELKLSSSRLSSSFSKSNKLSQIAEKDGKKNNQKRATNRMKNKSEKSIRSSSSSAERNSSQRKEMDEELEKEQIETRDVNKNLTASSDDEFFSDQSDSREDSKLSNLIARSRSVSVQRTNEKMKDAKAQKKDRLVSLSRSNEKEMVKAKNFELVKNQGRLLRLGNIKKIRSSAKRVPSSPSLDSENDEKDNKKLNFLEKNDETASPPKKSRIEKKSVKKVRKLYNPDDVVVATSSLEDDSEREEYLKKKTVKNVNEVFVNPNNLHISTLRSNNLPKTSENDSVISPVCDNNEVTKKKRVMKKKQTNNPSDYKSPVNDEQKSLLELLTEKVDGDDEEITRRSKRLSTLPTKPKYRFTSSVSETTSTKSIPITPIKRRSTLDFQPISQSQQKRRVKFNLKQLPSIVCTKMHRQEVQNFERIVKSLGNFVVENQVSDRTTHLVAGEPKRTINMLRAIARGCWVLKREWLLKSKEQGRWLPEEDYEVTEFSPAVQQCRLQKQAFGLNYRMDIFKECGLIYVAKSTTPKQVDLQELITSCQGKVTTIYRNATIVVGQYIRGEDVTCVVETWVLDSITFNKLKPFRNYIIKPEGVNSPHF